MAMCDTADEVQLGAALARCAAGDRAALRLIYDLEAPRMIGVVMRIVRRRDLAEDVVHDAFVRLWRSAKSFNPELGHPRNWLYAIARNRALSVLRDERRFVSSDGEDHPEVADPSAEDAVARLPEASRLRRCLDALEVRRRAAVVLAYVHGLSHGEIAGRLEVPLGTAKSWTRRGLLSLRECLG